jgi:hypothetical protein
LSSARAAAWPLEQGPNASTHSLSLTVLLQLLGPLLHASNEE